MPEINVQDEQGNVHVFPDGSTPEMIAQAMGVKTQAPATALPKSTATIGAAQTGLLPWLRNLEGDVRYGSNMTGAGRFLHAIGMQPTSAGVSPEVEQKMASPVLGPLKVAQGAAQLPGDPWGGTKAMVGGALQTMELPSMMAGPESAEAASRLPGAVASIPGKVGEAVSEAGGARNALAKVLRYPATARQSQLGRPGSVRALPSFLQRYVLPDWAVPKGELGTVTNPGPFAEIPTRIKPEGLGSIAERDATRQNVPFAGEEAQTAEQAAQNAMPRPLRPTVGTPEDFQVYDNQMGRLKQEAKDAGTYSAARGKIGKKKNYQERIVNNL